MTDTLYSGLADNLKQREIYDKPLPNWFLVLFLSFLTFGIYGLYIIGKRVLRVDHYISRKKEFYTYVLMFLERDEIHKKIKDDSMYLMLKDVVNNYDEHLKPIFPLISKILILVVIFYILSFIVILDYVLLVDFGFMSFLSLLINIIGTAIFILLWVYIYKMNRIWDDIQIFEKKVYEYINYTFISLNLMEKPVMYVLDKNCKKPFVIYVILSIITFGIMSAVWDYFIHTLPDKLYSKFHNTEDIVSNHMINYIKNGSI